MSVDRGEFPVAPSDPYALNPRILAIPLLEDLTFDTHSTSGEHALKESGAWNEFLARIEEKGSRPMVSQPFEHYLLQGPGLFYRAYLMAGDPMVAGMAISPNERGGFKLDHYYGIPQRAITAAAYFRMITRNFFEGFCGMPPLPRTSNLTIQKSALIENLDIARAVYDFGLIQGEDFVIPMPGVAPHPSQDGYSTEIPRAREVIQERQVTGVLPYLQQYGESDAITEEFYRHGALVGTLIHKNIPVVEESFRINKSLEGHDARGKPVKLRSPELRGTALSVHFLKTIAENDPYLAELILS